MMSGKGILTKVPHSFITNHTQNATGFNSRLRRDKLASFGLNYDSGDGGMG